MTPLFNGGALKQPSECGGTVAHVRSIEQIRYDGNRVGTGLYQRWRVVDRDAADGNDGQIEPQPRVLQQAEGRAHGMRLHGGRMEAAEGDVVGARPAAKQASLPVPE